MIIRNAVLRDIEGIVKLHQRAFPGFLMTILGKHFLKKYYFLVLSYSYHTAVLAETEDGFIKGFAVGFMYPERFYKLLQLHKIRLALSAFFYLAVRPILWSRVLRSLKQAENVASGKGYHGNVCELASVAVEPTSAGRGLGKTLVQYFIKEALKYKPDLVYLTTDAGENEMVNNFYLKIGFYLNRSFAFSKRRKMNEYVFRNSSLLIEK